MTTARRVAGGWLFVVLLSAATLSGASVYNFESCNQGPIGVWNNAPPPGCDGWYTTTGSTSKPASVGPYSFITALGYAADPRGGNQGLVLSGSDNASPTVVRAQHDANFSPSAEWSIAYDLWALNLNPSGNSNGTDYIGSFSVLNAGTTNSAFIVVNGWDNSSTGSTWTSQYDVYNATGTVGLKTPGAAWTGLSQNHWYSESTSFDKKTNRIFSVSITDLTTGVTTTVSPTDWYMAGGAGGVFGSNAFRFAGLGYTNGELVDNVTLGSVPEPASLLLTGLGFLALVAFRRR